MLKKQKYKSQTILENLYDDGVDKDTINYNNSPIHSDDSAHTRQVKKMAILKK